MKKYSVIYADPPWFYNDKSLHRGGSARHYDSPKLKDLKRLNVQSISSDNSVLIMWATLPMIRESLELIEAWGFAYKSCLFNWVKLNKRAKVLGLLHNGLVDIFIGQGHYSRSNSELCLIATRGKSLERKSKAVRQVIISPVGNHSKKPDEARKRIEQLYGDIPRIELFARKQSFGWDVWGNEVESNIQIEWKTKK